MVKQSLFLMAALLLPIHSAAQNPRPLGDEFQVNTYTTGDQTFPEIAADLLGNFVVVWHSAGSSGTDSDGFSIQGQRYDINGTPVLDHFQVNTYTTGDQIRPSVAYLPDGFVVVWQSDGSSDTDSFGFSIQGQLYDAMGNQDGAEFQINTYTTHNQMIPQVAADLAGNFVVVWESDHQDGAGLGIFGQRFDDMGNPAGGEFQVNTYITSNQYEPALAVDPGGDFVVIWQSAGQDGSGRGIYGQRYDATGNLLGGEFLVNTYTTDDQVLAQIGMDPAGNFIVVWQDRDKDPPWSIQAQRYDFMGNAVGGEFQVDTYNTNRQNYPSAAIDADGNFMVVWDSEGSFGTDNSSWSIQGQQYAPTGTPIGGQFQINTSTINAQRNPELVTDAAGNFLLVWHSQDSSGTDTDGWSVQGQRYYSTHIFTDGFESGDLTAWSFTVP